MSIRKEIENFYFIFSIIFFSIHENQFLSLSKSKFSPRPCGGLTGVVYVGKSRSYDSCDNNTQFIPISRTKAELSRDAERVHNLFPGWAREAAKTIPRPVQLGQILLQARSPPHEF